MNYKELIASRSITKNGEDKGFNACHGRAMNWLNNS